MKKILLVVSISLMIFTSCKDEITNPPLIIQSPGTSEFDASFATQWMNLAFEIVKLEDIQAPVCSRFYGYSGIAIYEAVCKGIPGSRSLAGQLRDMPEMPQPENELYDWPSVLASTMKIVSTNILYQPNQISLSWINDLYDQQIALRKTEIDEVIVNRSINYGEQIGNKIIEWSAGDNFLATRGMPYTPPSRQINPMFWEPTLPGQGPLEPYLGTQKPFCMQTQDQCSVPFGLQFDTIPGTPFYEEGYEVFDQSMNNTYDQRNIAFFWEDKAGTGQPPGHWVAITINMVVRFGLRLDAAAKIYALVGAGIRDAFISCWETKYRYNLLRPKTYIRDYIQPNWNELISTPPFPEYPSGHSVVSGACSKILTEWFGDNIEFTDSTHHNEPGLRNRNFSSFFDAADEAAWSRLYGGIHYKTGILNGIQQGRLVANVILNTIHFE